MLEAKAQNKRSDLPAATFLGYLPNDNQFTEQGFEVYSFYLHRA